VGCVEVEGWNVNRIEIELCRGRGRECKLGCVWVVERERVGMQNELSGCCVEGGGWNVNRF